MIASAKNYTKKKKRKIYRENPRTNGKSKGIQTKITKEAYSSKQTGSRNRLTLQCCETRN